MRGMSLGAWERDRGRTLWGIYGFGLVRGVGAWMRGEGGVGRCCWGGMGCFTYCYCGVGPRTGFGWAAKGSVIRALALWA